jgi:hypothetical protein
MADDNIDYTDNDAGYSLPGSSASTNVDAAQPGGASGSGLQVGVRTGSAETGYQTLNKDGSITYQDPDGTVYTKQPTGNYTGGSGSSSWTYDAGTGTSSLDPASPSSVWDQVSRQLKGLYSTNGQIDITKVAPLLAGLAAAGQSNTRTQPVGFQGSIPRYVATRQAPTQGQKLSGNVTYTPKAEGGSLASGGFVIPADVVSHFGNGSSDAGLRLLSQHMGAQPIRGHGDGMSDSIPTTIDQQEPARVANEEAYMAPHQVAQVGGGDAARGAQKLRDMMARIREARTGSAEQGRQINPTNYMPGGLVKGYAAGDNVSTTPSGAAVSSGLTGTESNLSNWVGPYVTDMLGKGQALSEMPYEQYTGPLTAGASTLQTQAFNTASQQANNPYTAVGKNFTADQAQQYMNPYLKAALDPQMAELQRQADIKRVEDASRLTKAGAYGGGRQAIMESEGARNLLDLQRKALGEGYATAYDKAMQQFNADQGRAVQEAQFGTTAGQQSLKTLADLGATQRGIEAEDVAAQKKQFEEARENPYKMVQFQQSLLSGLPLSAQQYNLSNTNDLTQFASGLTALKAAMDKLGITPPTGNAAPV